MVPSIKEKWIRNIVSRVIADTGMERDLVENFTKCFLLELSHELAVSHTIHLPYIGDLSSKNKILNPNKFHSILRRKGGFFASKIK